MNYTVNISLPKQLADLAKQKVKKGHFTSLSEVMRTALRNFLAQDVPTFRMSKKAERRARLARQEYKQGKLIKLSSIDDLDRL